jgi:hypothetical protein
MHEALKHPMVLHVAAISTCVLFGHDVAWPGEGIGGLKGFKFDEVAAHGGEHGTMERDFEALAPLRVMARI